MSAECYLLKPLLRPKKSHFLGLKTEMFLKSFRKLPNHIIKLFNFSYTASYIKEIQNVVTYSMDCLGEIHPFIDKYF